MNDGGCCTESKLLLVSLGTAGVSLMSTLGMVEGGEVEGVDSFLTGQVKRV
jgi:hypothetical protein